MAYDFLDAHSSILSADSSVIAASTHRPLIEVVGSVATATSGTQVTSLVSTVPSSVIVGASIFGALPDVTVTGLQGASVSGTVDVSGLQGASVSGTVDVTGLQGASVSGTVDVAGLQGASVSGEVSISGNVGASIVGLPAVIVHNSQPSSVIEGYASTVNVSVTTLVAAAGAGLRNYITDVMIANTGASDTLVTFKSQGGASILGYTIAPAGGGSNAIGFGTPIRTPANQSFDFQATTGTSILYATVKGYKAP